MKAQILTEDQIPEALSMDNLACSILQALHKSMYTDIVRYSFLYLQYYIPIIF